MTRACFFAAIIVNLSCSTDVEKGQIGGELTSAPAVQSGSSAGGPLLIVTQATVLPGSTSVAPMVGFVFLAPGFALSKSDPSDSFEKRISLVAQRARFLDDSGAAVPAEVSAQPSNGPDPKTLVIRPKEQLEARRWYALEILQDESVQVWAESEPLPTTPVTTPYRSHFFTGSAPRVRKVELPKGAKSADTVRIEFSESIDVATLSVGDLVQYGGKAVSKCILLNGVCSGSSTQTAVDSVVVMLSAVVPDNPETLRIALSGAAKGAGSSVEEGTQVAGGHLTAGALLANVGPADWRSCSAGAARCWTAPAPAIP